MHKYKREIKTLLLHRQINFPLSYYVNTCLNVIYVILMNKTKYKPDKELILTKNKNTLTNLLNKDIKKKYYESIREIVEETQEVIYHSNKENKVKKILPPENNKKKYKK